MQTVPTLTHTPGDGPCDGHQRVAPPWFSDNEPIPFWPTQVRDRSVTPLTIPFAGEGMEHR